MSFTEKNSNNLKIAKIIAQILALTIIAYGFMIIISPESKALQVFIFSFIIALIIVVLIAIYINYAVNMYKQIRKK